MAETSWYVYMVRCADDSLYTGMTHNLEQRLRQHLSRGSKGAKYTRSRPVIALEAAWTVPDEHTARSLEWHIKRLTRKEKLRLIADRDSISTLCNSAVPFPALNLKKLNEKAHTSE